MQPIGTILTFWPISSPSFAGVICECEWPHMDIKTRFLIMAWNLHGGSYVTNWERERMLPDDVRVTILQNGKGTKSRKVQRFWRMSGLCMFSFADGTRQLWRSPVEMKADWVLQPRDSRALGPIDYFGDTCWHQQILPLICPLNWYPAYRDY